MFIIFAGSNRNTDMERKFKVGDAVIHDEWGRGLVKFIDFGAAPYAVQFRRKTDHHAPNCRAGYGYWCMEVFLKKVETRTK